jgi:hypothetical protein
VAANNGVCSHRESGSQRRNGGCRAENNENNLIISKYGVKAAWRRENGVMAAASGGVAAGGAGRGVSAKWLISSRNASES